MRDEKLEFILKQLSKTNKKNYENYVITRIYNLLNDLEIKFITQQYISRGNGTYARTDMYFPQFNLHIEIDEGYHKNNVEADEIRESDIVNITNHTLLRIDVTKGIEEIHRAVHEIINYVRSKKREYAETFIPWDINNETNPNTYIKKGYIDVKENVAFRLKVDACSCFGLNHKSLQKGATRHPFEANTYIWFPKLYLNDKYTNRLSEDGNIIFESNNHKEFKEEEIVEESSRPNFINRRIVFASVRGPLGDTMYRFKGVFIFDYDKSIESKCFVWKKTSERVKTYKYNAG